VLLKMRFAAYADQPEESKNVPMAITPSTIVHDGIRAALERCEKDPLDWRVLSVKCFDDDFEELVDVRGDDGLENLRKYEVQLQRWNPQEDREENREEDERDELEEEQQDSEEEDLDELEEESEEEDEDQESE
jgi:hypothetical protein